MSEELKNPQLKSETIQLIQGNEDLMNFIQDIRAVSHNNALRMYEMSCILDGVMNFLRHNGYATTDELYNYINISSNLKEYTVHSEEKLDFMQFFEKFCPQLSLEDLKEGKRRMNMQEILENLPKSKN